MVTINRIMVIGISAGVGKSTFARRLGKALDIQVYHLDTFFWKPGWVEATLDEFSKAQQEVVDNEDSWIMEGNYNGTYEIRAKKADTIIYLELPLRVCLFRVWKRFFANIGRTRADLGEGCKEKLDWKFIKFIYTTYYPRKRIMEERFRTYGAGKEIIKLKSKKEIEDYIQLIENKKSSVLLG